MAGLIGVPATPGIEAESSVNPIVPRAAFDKRSLMHVPANDDVRMKIDRFLVEIIVVSGMGAAPHWWIMIHDNPS